MLETVDYRLRNVDPLDGSVHLVKNGTRFIAFVFEFPFI